MTQAAVAPTASLYPTRPFVLHKEGGFRYFNASDVPGSEIVRLLAESFAREPMALALGAGAPELAGLIERFMPECRTNGLSVVAVPEDGPDVLAAAFLTRDFKARLPEGVLEDFPWFLPVGEALMRVGEAYETRHPGLAPGDAADLWMVGTDPRFAGRGIAARLFRICAELARENGFRRCVTECTGRFSQKAAERAGFSEVSRLSYGDFRFDGRAVFAAVPAPHTHLAIYDRAL
ncbi:MAG TPA: GNAT family N-acetyltransferase [Burkholderiales bacterium]|nr:GNAT family N-acetyltransferase [Burkholderiales bacterium]